MTGNEVVFDIEFIFNPNDGFSSLDDLFSDLAEFYYNKGLQAKIIKPAESHSNKRVIYISKPETLTAELKTPFGSNNTNHVNTLGVPTIK